ncbi:high affinity immunoglobulin alpha and immunoglobulin mu Fc receptor [Diceros bicornis minor]|uniref:high affinity immunoglobulin alpha and immunoglobulin mu Fc receptor n=1 Tax=Diceros bicornis minor TaxID=77932 RepID=UPI0026ED1E5F|nr:high affinity immunoglobulin alpha and immunoglobulin mu Fc receptor [Diceros bicornis minor]
MDGEAPAKPGEQKVTNQRAGWKMPVLLMLCLLQAANALKGPRLVSGPPGGTVTIQCHYAPLVINRHQRKYWCRLSPLTWICHTIVSTNHYTHPRYRGRVALADFPKSGLFVVRLSQLSPDDVGRYRCGLGNRNHVLFFSMNLTVSAGPSSASPTATPAAELVSAPFGTASPAANRWTPGATQTIERQGTGWDRVALTPGTSKTTASARGRQTPGTTRAAAPGTGSRVEGSVRATVPIPESLASAIRGVSSTTEGVWAWGTSSSVANGARANEEGRETTTNEAERPGEETERVRITLDAARKVIGTIRPSTLVSEKWAWETLQEAPSVSKPQALGSVEGITSAAGVWTMGPTSMEMASVEGSAEGDLDMPAGDSGPQATPSQALGAGPLQPPGKESSMNSASPEEKNISWILTPVATALLPLTLVTLVLLQRKLWRKWATQDTERAAGATLIHMTHFLELSLQPGQLPHGEGKMLQDDSSLIHASLSVPERDPGP